MSQWNFGNNMFVESWNPTDWEKLSLECIKRGQGKGGHQSKSASRLSRLLLVAASLQAPSITSCLNRNGVVFTSVRTLVCQIHQMTSSKIHGANRDCVRGSAWGVICVQWWCVPRRSRCCKIWFNSGSWRLFREPKTAYENRTSLKVFGCPLQGTAASQKVKLVLPPGVLASS